MSIKKPTNVKDFLIHLGIMIGATILIVMVVFFVWLPASTNHGETITVPDVQGMTVDELDEFLGKRNLRYEPTADSSYSPNYPPLAVLRQVPKPNTKVKENRKIYVTLNAESPPLVKCPKLIDLSLKAVQMVLKSYDLKLGEVKYVPDPVAFGTVHEARLDGRVVLEGERIQKGSVIDLFVGDGYGNTQFQAPYLIGLDQEEAEVAIIGSGLKVGKVVFTEKSRAGYHSTDSLESGRYNYREVLPGSVQNQYPIPQKTVAIGDRMDIWIFKPDSLNDTSTILDNQ